MSDYRLVTVDNLGADFRGVGSKIVNDSFQGGAGAPTAPPVEPEKVWGYIDTNTDQITHYWSPLLSAWVTINTLGKSVKVINTSVTQNIGSTTAQNFSELFGTTEWNDDNLYVVNNADASITLPTNGRYEAKGYWSMVAGTSTNSARNNIAFWLERGGIEITPRFQDNYVRDTTGHNEVGQSLNAEFNASAGDVIVLRRQRVSGAGGGQNLQGTNNFLIIKRIG